MSEKYVLMKDDNVLAEFSSWTEAQEMERFMRRWHPERCYEIRAENFQEE